MVPYQCSRAGAARHVPLHGSGVTTALPPILGGKTRPRSHAHEGMSVIVAARPGTSRAGSSRRLPRLAFVLALLAVMLAGSPAMSQGAVDPSIAATFALEPAGAGPGEAATIRGTVEIDPGSGSDAVSWSVTVGDLEGFTIEEARCGETSGTTCEASLNTEAQVALVSGTVQDQSADQVTAELTLRGRLAEEPASDALAIRAETCATIAGTDTLRALQGPPAAPGTPAVDRDCDGTEGTIEFPLPAATPTAEPTVEPTEAPTATPTAEPSPTPEPTEEPTAAPTEQPSPTPTEEPSPTPTDEPTPTEAITATPTEAPSPTPTATPEPTATPTEEPAPTATPTAEPSPTPTAEPTDVPTEPPTEEPTQAATEAPVETAVATEAPQPTPADGDDTSAGLWIGVASLVVLAAAAGAVIYQRRKLTGG